MNTNDDGTDTYQHWRVDMNSYAKKKNEGGSSPALYAPKT
jgi:hypothetical protein